ncbi:MAG TPA: flagellar basal body protein FliL [Syntrophus sp. (in: bacteria)]|nr:flagellar basal body protein FliL [Syntrophus sp. (in: bacteria)]
MAKGKNDELGDAEQLDPQPQKKGNGPLLKWIIILSVVLVLVIGGGGAGYYFFMKTPAKKVVVQAPPVIGTVYPMEPFIINLQDNQGERYLKLIMQLEISDPLGVKELDMLKPRMRDNILDLLSAKTYKELMDVGGKQRLREEILMRLNSIVSTAKISKVYFTEFVVQ